MPLLRAGKVKNKPIENDNSLKERGDPVKGEPSRAINFEFKIPFPDALIFQEYE